MYKKKAKKINKTQLFQLYSTKRITLAEKRKRRYVWRNYGKFWRGRSMRTSWTFYLERPCQQIRNKIGLFQDDELAVFKNTKGPQAEKIRKQITKRFKENGLKITIQCNLKSADYLDATLNLTNVPFQPYRKLNDEPPYTKSNHIPTVIKQVSKAINRRLSSKKETFDLSTTKPSDQVD